MAGSLVPKLERKEDIGMGRVGSRLFPTVQLAKHIWRHYRSTCRTAWLLLHGLHIHNLRGEGLQDIRSPPSPVPPLVLLMMTIIVGDV